MNKINSINKITSFSGLEIAVRHYLEEGPLSDEMMDALVKKYDQLKVYSGFYIGRNYDLDNNYFYVLLINDEGVQQCTIHKEKDFYKLIVHLEKIDKSLPISITGNGLLIQGNNEIKFNTSLNTEYIE